MFCQSVIKMSRKVLTLSERVEAIKLHDGGKSSRDVAQIMGSLYIIIYIHTHVHVYIYVKPPDEYLWQGRNSFNSGIFVILKKLWTLNYRSPLFSSQFLPALKSLFKSSLTVLMWPLNTIRPLSQFLRIITMWPLNTLHWPSSQSLSALHCWLKMTQRRSGLNGGHPGLSPCK